jgi:peptidoglycan/LPS O-acetylase OafA/YrhL
MKKENAEEKALLGKISKACKDKRVRIVIEWLGIGLMSFVAFIPRGLQTGEQWPQIYHSLYWGLSKPVFILGMGMTILPTILGHRHSFFNFILTPKLFHFIARISFCTYLVHLMVLYYFILSRNYNIYYNIVDNFITYLGLLIVSLIYGFISTVLVELPFAKIQKEVISMLKAKQKAK